MNYVILNGVKNTDVKGLMIQALPPISKPLMRTQIVQVDGRDGDLVTPLGYAAYDKTVLIGLRGDFDVDAVIAYFASEGTVIFSNEPDKAYQYKILAQIDFEKLLRFRQATVVFHVQPFKVPSVENTIRISTRLPFEIAPFQSAESGITIETDGHVISLYGESASSVSFTVPINPLTLNRGQTYTMAVLPSSAIVPTGSAVRLLTDAEPIDNNHSFGGNAILFETKTFLREPNREETTTYRYLYVSIPGGTIDCTVSFEVVAGETGDVEIRNVGNVIAKPKITLYGYGDVTLSLNGTEALEKIEFGADVGHITIDVAELEAFKDTLDNLQNRKITGDYNDLKLPVGKNILSWTGIVAFIEVNNYSRWI